MTVERYRGLEATPDSVLGLIDRQEGLEFFRSQAWFRNFDRHGLYPGMSLETFVVGGSQNPQGLSIAVRPENPTGLLKPATLQFAHPDQIEFQAYAASPSITQGEIVERIIAAVSEGEAHADVLRIGSFDTREPFMAEVRQILQRQGFLTQRYFVCANWYEDVNGASADEYLAARPKTLHDIVKRRSKRLEKQAAGQIQILHGGDQLAMGIADYVRIAAASWQGRNIMARDYLPTVLKLAASHGVLRLGLIYVDGRPAGAQICLVSGGMARFYRTAFDPQFRRFSVGTLIIHDMVRHVIDVDKVERIDFGIGDQAYKEAWAGTRRELWAIAAFNRRSLPGLANAARDFGASFVKRALGRSKSPTEEPS